MVELKRYKKKNLQFSYLADEMTGGPSHIPLSIPAYFIILWEKERAKIPYQFRFEFSANSCIVLFCQIMRLYSENGQLAQTRRNAQNEFVQVEVCKILVL